MTMLCIEMHVFILKNAVCNDIDYEIKYVTHVQ